MTIKFSGRFRKQYQHLPVNIQQQFKRRLALWQEDPYNSLLRRHRLEGKLDTFFSINVSGDVRALYEELANESYIFQMIGTHTELYDK